MHCASLQEASTLACPVLTASTAPSAAPQWDTTAIGDGSVGVVALQIRSMMRVRPVALLGPVLVWAVCFIDPRDCACHHLEAFSIP